MQKLPAHGMLKLGPAPYRVKIKLSKSPGCVYAKKLAHGFNEEEKTTIITEPSSLRYEQNVTVWFAPYQTS